MVIQLFNVNRNIFVLSKIQHYKKENKIIYNIANYLIHYNHEDNKFKIIGINKIFKLNKKLYNFIAIYLTVINANLV